MTSDGISDDDWTRVRELAVDLYNADIDEQIAQARSTLLSHLDKLEAIYGVLPSILATKADFIDDPSAKTSLLCDAYALAELKNDRENALHVAHSLATLYLEDVGDVVRGGEWLGRLKDHLEALPDEQYREDYVRLS